MVCCLPDPRVAAACFIKSCWCDPSGMFFFGLKVLDERDPLWIKRGIIAWKSQYGKELWLLTNLKRARSSWWDCHHTGWVIIWSLLCTLCRKCNWKGGRELPKDRVPHRTRLFHCKKQNRVNCRIRWELLLATNYGLCFGKNPTSCEISTNSHSLSLSLCWSVDKRPSHEL